jgi:hypothetical protein
MIHMFLKLKQYRQLKKTDVFEIYAIFSLAGMKAVKQKWQNTSK